MNNLYYGNGQCSITGNISSISIYYEGRIIIDSKLPVGYYIKMEESAIHINTVLELKPISELFNYYGYFKIRYVDAYDLHGSKLEMTVTTSLDFPESMFMKSEEINTVSEKLNASYTYSSKVLQNKLLPKVYEGLHTESTVKTLMLDDEEYSGSYHLHVDGSIMTGVTHTKESKTLVVK